MDSASRRLTRDGEVIPLPSRHFDVLLHLVSRAGDLVSKDALIEAAWAGIAVTDNSLEQAISALRRSLGSESGGERYIQTVPRQGYRFNVPVTRLPSRASDASLDALLAPHRAWIEGRAALETLERSGILHARDVFAGVLASVPDLPAGHIGLANACIMQYEMTRADHEPEVASRAAAEHHAREACRLDPESAEAWATLGLVLDRVGRPLDALAATQRAVMLEPDNWRHYFRRGYVAWGEERLRAAHRTMALMPGFPLAHWLAATVHVARQVFDDAERELAAGISVQRRQAVGTNRFSAVALHWLQGLVSFARGDADAAVAALERELAAEGSGHLYARECCAHAWYAIGAIRLRQSRTADASEAFQQALQRVPGHPMSVLGIAAASGSSNVPSEIIATRLAAAERRLTPVDVAILRAAHLSLRGSSGAGAPLVEEALLASPDGSAGWLIPVEPLLRVFDHADQWASVLSRLRARAA